MTKTILYRLFKAGGIPDKLRPVLESENIVVCDEGINGWYITKNFKAPGKRALNRKEGFSGFLAVTKKRVICYSFGKRQINISTNDPKISYLYQEIVTPDTIAISFDSSYFHDGWQGIIEFWFKTEKTQDFHDALTAIGLQQGNPQQEPGIEKGHV